MKSIFNFAAMLLISIICCTSCSDVEYAPATVSSKVSDLQYSLDGRNVTLTWSMPSEQSISGVNIYCNNELAVALEGAATSYTLKGSTGVDLAYTVKVAYSDGRVSEGETVRLYIDPIPVKYGYLMTAANADALPDDDEVAAAKWFTSTFSNGVFITPSELSSIDPDDVSVIWVQIDRVGIDMGWRNLPSEYLTDEVINGLKSYSQKGGNLFLTKHATQLAIPVGILDEQYAPNLFGSGEGGEGSDNWTTNAWLGVNMSDGGYDHRSHAIFAGLTTLPDFGFETFALEGPGWREDHNCCWDCNAYGFNGDPNVIVNFEQATNSTVLSTWGHVGDYCVAGTVEFNATTQHGRCIAIGLSAYEFNQRTGNIYQANTERFTSNCIEYLGQ